MTAADWSRLKTLRAWTYEMPDGKIEQFQIAEN